MISTINIQGTDYPIGASYDNEGNVIADTYALLDNVNQQINDLKTLIKLAVTGAENVNATITNLEGDIQTVDKEIQDINSRHNALNTKHESLSRTVQGIAATGEASTATNVTYNNDTSGLNAENAQDAIDELQVSKIDKISIAQELGNSKNLVVSQKAITDWINKGYQFIGVATPITNPGTQDKPVFYLAGEGVYPNFANLSVGVEELAVLVWNNNWSKKTVKHNIINIYDIPSLNKINKDTLIEDTSITVNGQEVQTPGKVSSPYLRIGKRKEIYTNIYETGGICAFDENFQSLRYLQITSTDSITLNDNVKYIRFYFNESSISRTFLYQLSDVSEYVEFGITEEDYKQNKSISLNTENIANNAIDITVLKNSISKIIPSSAQGNVKSVIKSGNFSDGNNFIQGSVNIQPISFDDDFFKNNFIEKIINPKKEYNEASGYDVSFFSDNSEFGRLIKANLDKYTRIECYIYCKEKKFDTITLRFYSNTTPQGDTKLPYEDTESPYVKKFVTIYNNSVLESKPSAYLYCNCTIKGLTTNIDKADFGFTGFKAALFNSLEDAKNNSIQADWITIGDNNDSISQEEVLNIINSEVPNIINNIDLGEHGTIFNKVALNQKKLGLALRLLKGELPKGLENQFNRVLVSMNGDSIIGAQLDDLTHADGYDTGDFPPNMSKITMARKFWDKYRFSDEDVIFRNLIHSDWTKQGFSISNGKGDKRQTFNEIEVYGCENGNYAEITITGKKYIKFVWSEYKGKPYSFDIMQTIDTGTETKLETVTVTAERKLMTAYKIYKLSEIKSYKFKIIPKSGFNDICFWGIEAWSKPRLDVVVEAFSGSTAKINRELLLDGYYSYFHRPSLLISDTLIINDTSYINSSDYSIDQWTNDQALIYEYLKKNGVPSLFIIPHHPIKSYVTQSIYDMAELHNLNIVDIPSKIKIQPPAKSIVNSTDGLHLSNYGQTYYFEELERIIDNYSIVE